ncbi:lytic polysaccharide monooxygenase [Parathielavia appendiculata]|uniref:lytic cellulose monooxygenase (C4-dehydrogenating) n=1 Tax=Parathielavia appendiculata TaxID=2587402 RepID=A0AAN6YYG8_9PEZI|nr:lytic polysaccharide monooxygenase [Parathielavia appendiculata]
MRSALTYSTGFFLATLVSGHGHVSQVTIAGISYYGHDPTKVPWGPQPDSITWSNGAKDNGYVASDPVTLASRDVNCHLNATNGKLVAQVAAGSDIAVTWNDWPVSHHGPVLDYMADCGADCTTVDLDELRWFKIDEMGQLEKSTVGGVAGRWATDLLIEKNLTWTVTIPTHLKPGNYVLRHELIALHPGGAENSTQLYPQCINLNVTGEGTVLPKGTPGSQLYSSQDPGLVHNIYTDFWLPNRDYIIPGPSVFNEY